MVKLDKILLTNFYRKQGFLMVTINDSLVIKKAENQVEIFYDIIEGRKYILKRINFTGNNRITKEQLNNVFFELLTDSTFEEGIINTGKQQIENIY